MTVSFINNLNNSEKLWSITLNTPLFDGTSVNAIKIGTVCNYTISSTGIPITIMFEFKGMPNVVEIPWHTIISIREGELDETTRI